MRILHTADWHLGKLFYGNYLTEDQAYVLEQQFLPLLRDEGIDAVVLAGFGNVGVFALKEALDIPVLCQPPPGAAGALYRRRIGPPHRACGLRR